MEVIEEVVLLIDREIGFVGLKTDWTRLTCWFCCGEWEALYNAWELECPHCGCGQVQDVEELNPTLRFFCLACEEVWIDDLRSNGNRLVCPHCGSEDVDKYAQIVRVTVVAEQLELQLR